jgi:hypothetical protein
MVPAGDRWQTGRPLRTAGWLLGWLRQAAAGPVDSADRQAFEPGGLLITTGL